MKTRIIVLIVLVCFIFASKIVSIILDEYYLLSTQTECNDFLEPREILFSLDNANETMKELEILLSKDYEKLNQVIDKLMKYDEVQKIDEKDEDWVIFYPSKILKEEDKFYIENSLKDFQITGISYLRGNMKFFLGAECVSCVFYCEYDFDNQEPKEGQLGKLPDGWDLGYYILE